MEVAPRFLGWLYVAAFTFQYLAEYGYTWLSFLVLLDSTVLGCIWLSLLAILRILRLSKAY